MQYLKSVSKLSVREKKIWNLIRSKSGVVMAYGIPGISKSATFKSIANKMGLKYFDLRASTLDETDLGVFPTISEKVVSGLSLKIVDHAVPSWAIEANETPSLIHFEELNRCSSSVRNAVLGILLERIIGCSFNFNNHVYMVASGNPISDFDDVEEFGFALRNRLIPIQFELTLNQWINEFAHNNVHPIVIDFLKTKPDFFGNTYTQLNKFIDKDSMTQYPSPRSWTFLSDYLKEFNSDEQKEILNDRKTFSYFVGEIASTAFVNYVMEVNKISVKDILIGKKIDNLDNMTIQRITTEFHEEYLIHNLNTKELENWMFFIDIMSDEIKAGHLSSIACNLKNLTEKEICNYNLIFKKYNEISKIILKTI